MLYVIKEDKLYLTLTGNYDESQFRHLKTIEDDRENLVYNKKTKELEERKLLEINPVVTISSPPSLEKLIAGTDLWERVVEDGALSLRLNIAVTLLIAAVTSTKNNEGFKQAMSKYFKGLKECPEASLLTRKEKELLQDMIDKSEFNLDLKTL